MDGTKGKILAAASMHHTFNDASVVILPTIFPALYTGGVLIKRYSDIGIMTLIGLMVALLFQFWIGHSAKRRHFRALLALDAAIVGASLLSMTQARSYTMLLLCFIGVRIGTSIYHPVGIAWISRAFRGGGLDRAMGFQSVFGDIGVLVSFVSTGLLVDHLGWRAPLVIWGLLNFAAAMTGYTVSRGTGDFDRSEEGDGERVSWRETLSSMRVFIPLMILAGLSWGITLNYAPNLLNHRLGISMSNTGLVLSCWMAGGTLATVFYGRISEAFGRGRAVLASYAIVIAAAFTISFSTNTRLTVTTFILYGIALFITYPALLSFVGNNIAERNRTAAFSALANIQILGNSVFATASGFLSDIYGIQTPFLVLGTATVLVAAYTLLACRAGRISCAAGRQAPAPPELVRAPEDIVR